MMQKQNHIKVWFPGNIKYTTTAKMITTRQKSTMENLKELQHLREEIHMLRHKNSFGSNQGTISFIFACSLFFTWVQMNPYLMHEADKLLKRFGLDYNVDDLNILDRSILTSMYHYFVFKAISHRFIVSVALGVSLLLTIPGAYQEYFVGS